MVKRGSNFIPLVLDTRLLVALNGKASAKNQLNATYIMGLLVEHCKEDLPQDVYEELKKRYEKTINEQYAEKQVKEKERLELERKKLELKERELNIRDANREIRTENQLEEKQTEIDKIKDYITEMRDSIKYAERHNNPQLKAIYEQQLADAEAKLKELEGKA
jgi:hypothetical protein